MKRERHSLRPPPSGSPPGLASFLAATRLALKRQQTLGQALVGAYIESARQAGFETLSLHVRADDPARRLYERAGFGHVGANALGYLRYELQVAG